MKARRNLQARKRRRQREEMKFRLYVRRVVRAALIAMTNRMEEWTLLHGASPMPRFTDLTDLARPLF